MATAIMVRNAVGAGFKPAPTIFTPNFLVQYYITTIGSSPSFQPSHR